MFDCYCCCEYFGFFVGFVEWVFVANDLFSVASHDVLTYLSVFTLIDSVCAYHFHDIVLKCLLSVTLCYSFLTECAVIPFTLCVFGICSMFHMFPVFGNAYSVTLLNFHFIDFVL